jgi:hypothetical protein
MNKKLLVPIIALMFFAASNIFAADPFEAPAVFDFSGSIIYLEAKVTLPFIGEVDVDIDPNPVPIDAKIYVDTLDADGYWTGYGEGSGTTTASAGSGMVSFTAYGEAGGSGEGWFDFPNDKVTIYSEDAWAKLEVGGTPYNFDIDEGEVEGAFDGTYMTYYYSGTETMNITGFNFTITYDIEAIGELETEVPVDSLTALIETNAANYFSGDTFDCTIGLERVGPAITVDAWIVLLNPAGQLLFFPGYTTDISLIPNLMIPADFSLYDVSLSSQTLPGSNPPIDNFGGYTVAFGLSEPGTINFLTIGSKAFNFTTE